MKDGIAGLLGYTKISSINPVWAELNNQLKEVESDISICNEIVKYLDDFFDYATNCEIHMKNARDAISKGLVTGNNDHNIKIDDIVDSVSGVKGEINTNKEIFNGQISALKLQKEELKSQIASTNQYIYRYVREQI